MKIILVALLIGISAATTFAADTDTNAIALSPSIAKDSRCFELRTYHAAPGKLEPLLARFRDHTLALFKKHGMEVVGFWVPTDADKGAGNTLVYLLAHKSREDAAKSWDAFRNDPEWKQVVKESEANGKLTIKTESVFLAATDFSPLK
jgi:hypothetical protein